MSDVLRFIKSNALLLTGLTHTQVVRTAEIAEPSQNSRRYRKGQIETRLDKFEQSGFN
jgi:hypothetical protein